MTLMQQWLAQAARELGLRISLRHAVVLADGRTLTSQALFPDLGAERGTLVFDAVEQLDSEASKELRAKGYTASSFHQPLHGDEFDLRSYAEMFSEWGWTGDPAAQPSWMNGDKDGY